MTVNVGRSSRKNNRGSLPAHLERLEQIVDIGDKVCPCGSDSLHQIGEDVANRLDVVPDTFRVLVTRRPRMTVASKRCDCPRAFSGPE